MNFRKITLLAVTAAALAPVVSNASPERAALKACAQAFATSLASPGASAPSYKLAYRGTEFSGSMIEFYNRDYTFELHAQDPKTGAPLARASCSTDLHGNVVALSAIPLDAASPALAAQL